MNHVIRFHVKIVFLVTEIFVFCIQAKVTLLAFAQRHGVILSEILGKRGCRGRSPHLKGGAADEAQSSEYILLCLNKVRKDRLV